jgi:hypothetical protein
MPHPTREAFQIDFDFPHHRLHATTVAGASRSLDLDGKPVADFYNAVMAILEDLGVPTTLWPMPVEIAGAMPFDEDRTHASYDTDAVRRFWHALVDISHVFKQFRSSCVGESSPVFWGALDLAHTRFSGCPAPPHPGGAPNCVPHVMWEAYSHEVSSCGLLAGPTGRGRGSSTPTPTRNHPATATPQ